MINERKMVLGCLDMEIVLASLVYLILTACPVYTVNTCGAAPNGDTICLYRTSAAHSLGKMACEGMQEHLAEILDQPTQDFINNNLLDPGMDGSSLFWIGLSLDTTVYRWDTAGTVVSYDNFDGAAVKNGQCVAVVGVDGEWQDIICGATLHGYFCQKAGSATQSNLQTTNAKETTTLTTLPASTTQRQTTPILTTTHPNDFTTTKKLTSIETTTSTSLASTTTVKEATTETPSTARDETTIGNRPTTLQTTTLASLPPSTTTQQQITSSTMKTTTTKEEMESTVAGLTSTNYVITTMIGETTSSQTSAKTTQAVSSDKGTVHKTTDTELTSFVPLVTSESSITTVSSSETSTKETTALETTTEPSTERTITNGNSVITGTGTVTPILQTTHLATVETTLPSFPSATRREKETITQTTPSVTVSTGSDDSTVTATRSLTDETTEEANPTTAKTTRFLNSTPRGTTSMAPSTASPTSLGFGATASVTPTTTHDGTTPRVPPSGTTLQTDLIQSTPTDESRPNLTSTTGETSTQTNNSTTSSVSDFKELSTEACNGPCELTLEERLVNATLSDVSDIVENEDLGSEDILQIQGWFEDNVYVHGDEENYLSYTRAYLHTFNEILTSTKEDTFDLANPAVFAESCNELLEDFAGKWSFNVSLEISYSNIETELVRESADTFEGFTSDFNTAQNKEQLDGYISIQNDWVEDYNTTDNSTIDIIVVMYQASTVDSLGNDETNEIVSNFVSITVVVDGETISLPVIFGLQLDEEKLKADKKGKQVYLEPLCVFWEYSLGNDSAGYWSTYGCAVMSQNATYVQCSCNHTTNFAILMQSTEVEISPEDEAALSLLSVIGLGISTAALLITIIVLVCLPSLKSDRVFIHKHLVVALIIAQSLFISTLGAVHQELICKLVAIFLHYFYLAVFMWMLIEGVHLYLEIVQVFSRFDGKVKTIHYTVAGWGLPLIVVGVSVGIRWENYGVGNGCWLSIADGLIWAFLGPVAFVILINFIILLMVIRVVFRASSARGKEDSEYKHLVAALKGALFLLPLLGLTWAVGFMSVNEGTVVFQYLFVILNSLQGLFIFLFYCAMNKEVRTALSRRFSQVALESGGSKSLSLLAVVKLKNSGKSTSPVFRFTDSSGASVVPSKSSGLHSEDDGKRDSISASGISVHQKEPDSQPIHKKIEPSQSPFSPNYD